MIGQDQINELQGKDVYDSDGHKIGGARQVFIDDETGSPEWVTVRTGLLGMKETFIPLDGSDFSGDRISVPYTKSFVKGAPNIDENSHLSQDQERDLYTYYNRSDFGDDTASGGRTASEPVTTSGVTPTSADNTEGAMTVSEERVDIGTRKQETGRVRLRKYVVTENVTKTVPVTREEVRVEREPITEANRDAALSGSEISEEEHEIILHEEVPVVEKKTVPVERVRLDTETVTEEHTVNEEVRKERVDIEGDAGDDSRTTR